MPTTAHKTGRHSPDDLKTLLREAERALGSTAGKANGKFDELRGRLRSALASGSYSLGRLRAEATRRAKQADHLVRERPYQALGIAAGVGAVVGLLVSRSRNGAR